MWLLRRPMPVSTVSSGTLSVTKSPSAVASIDLEDVRKHLDRHAVSKYYWPERLEIVAKLPRNPSGKVQKFLLREQAKAMCPLMIPEVRSA